MEPLLNLIPEKYAAYGAAAIVVVQIGGRIYHAFVSGSGLVGAWRAFLYGTNTPKPQPQTTQENTDPMKTIKTIILLFTASILLASSACAQTDTNTVTATNASTTSVLWDSLSQSGLLKATNYSFEPYATYAPSAPRGSKVGAGIFAAYNINDYVGAGLGVDYLGQFSIVSANLQLKYPTRPFASFGGYLTNVVVTPFVLAGVGKGLSGTANSAIVVSDVGGYVGFGHLWGGQFNAGAAWGRWDNAGIFSGPRYHVFAGWSKGF